MSRDGDFGRHSPLGPGVRLHPNHLDVVLLSAWPSRSGRCQSPRGGCSRRARSRRSTGAGGGQIALPNAWRVRDAIWAWIALLPMGLPPPIEPDSAADAAHLDPSGRRSGSRSGGRRGTGSPHALVDPARPRRCPSARSPARTGPRRGPGGTACRATAPPAAGGGYRPAPASRRRAPDRMRTGAGSIVATLTWAGAQLGLAETRLGRALRGCARRVGAPSRSGNASHCP